MSAVINVRYTLLEHLKNWCKSMPIFEPLLFAFSLDELDTSNKLETLSLYFGHYSKHDISHSKAIVSIIERLLGEERIKVLSATDTWLILMSAITHDLGMLVDKETLDSVWNNACFTNHVQTLKESESKDLSFAACLFMDENNELIPFSKLNEKIASNNNSIRTVIETSWHARLLVADFFRKTHAATSERVINENIRAYAHNESIHDRLIHIIAQCASSHGQGWPELEKNLRRRTDGFCGDYAHPRFVAALLRIGDVCDIDNQRFNEYILGAFGGMPDTSKAHFNKHKAIDHMLISPERVEVTANIITNNIKDQDELFLTIEVLGDWFRYIDNEIQLLSENWFKIVPETMPGSAPLPVKSKILIDGRSYEESEVLSRFTIDYRRALQIIQNQNLYTNKLSFCRELIQNAYDATKIQIFRLISFEKSDGLFEEVDKNYQNDDSLGFLSKTIEFLLKYAEQYQVKLIITKTTNKLDNVDYIGFQIVDNGTGIDKSAIVRMQAVGSVLPHEKKYEIDKMPGWLKPTGQFGIGLHSALMHTDTVHIKTFAAKEGYCAEILLESYKKGGKVISVPAHLIRKGRVICGTSVFLKVDNRKLETILYPAHKKSCKSDYLRLSDAITESIMGMLAPNITKFVIEVMGEGNKPIFSKSIPSVFDSLSNYVNESEVDKIAWRLKKILHRDCLIWYESKSENNLCYGLLSDFLKNHDRMRDLLLRVEFGVINGVNEISISHKGSSICLANDQVIFPYISGNIFILGRKASITTTVQREYILTESFIEIQNNAFNVLNEILIDIADKRIANSWQRGLLVLGMYLHRLLWQNTKVNLIDEKKIRDYISDIVNSNNIETISGYRFASGTFYNDELISGNDFLQDPLAYYYTRKIDRIISLEIDAPDIELTDGTILLTSLWDDMAADLKISEVHAVEYNNEVVYIIRYTVDQATEIKISENSLNILLCDHIRKGKKYIPCFEQYRELKTFECDGQTLGDWVYSSGYVRLPDIPLDDNEYKNLMYDENGRLKSVKNIDTELVEKLFQQQFVWLSNLSQSFDEEDKRKAMQKFICLIHECEQIRINTKK